MISCPEAGMLSSRPKHNDREVPLRRAANEKKGLSKEEENDKDYPVKPALHHIRHTRPVCPGSVDAAWQTERISKRALHPAPGW